MAYKEVKLEKGGGKALNDSIGDSNMDTIKMGKALRSQKPAPAKKTTPKKK